jgi:hypothetical protein
MTSSERPAPSALPKPDHRSLPRKKRPPSERDQALFDLQQAKGWTQERIAIEHRLSQSRVSQILRRVAAWREAQQRAQEAERVGEQDRRQSRLERARQEELYSRALRELDGTPSELTMIRRTHRGQAMVCETTTRQQLPSVQWLKLALRAAEALAAGSDQRQEQDEQLRQLTSVLAAVCCEVEFVRQRLSSLEAGAGASNASNLTRQDLAQVPAASELASESSPKK